MFWWLWAEIGFTLLIVVACFLIFFKTKETYALTKHQGIQYFRMAFLFLGFAYVLRLLFASIMATRQVFDLPREILFHLFIFLFGYVSTVSILYLLLSVSHTQSKKFFMIGHGLAILLSVVVALMRSPFLLLMIHAVMLVIAIIWSFAQKKKTNTKYHMRWFYVLVAVFWLLNLLMVDRRRLFDPIVEIIVHILAIAVIALIYWKVLKWS